MSIHDVLWAVGLGNYINIMSMTHVYIIDLVSVIPLAN